MSKKPRSMTDKFLKDFNDLIQERVERYKNNLIRELIREGIKKSKIEKIINNHHKNEHANTSN